MDPQNTGLRTCASDEKGYWKCRIQNKPSGPESLNPESNPGLGNGETEKQESWSEDRAIDCVASYTTVSFFGC